MIYNNNINNNDSKETKICPGRDFLKDVKEVYCE